MKNVFYYSDSTYKQAIKDASNIDLSTGTRGLIPTVAKLIKSNGEYPNEALKHVFETFIIICDVDGCLHYVLKNLYVTIHKARKYNGGFILIVTGNLLDWRELIINNDRLNELNQIQTLLEQKYPRLFIDYSKVKKEDVFELIKK